MAGLEDRSPAEAFAWLLAPLTEQQFFERHWEKCPLHLRGADAGRFRGLLSQRVIESRLASKPGLIYGKDINLARCGANGEQIMCNGTGRAGAEAVQKKVREGCSVQVVHPQRFGSEVACLLSKLESHFGCLWGANSFRTPPGGKGFKAHHDEVEVFMLQLEGAKRWRLHRCPEGPLPRSYCWDYEGKDLGEPLMELVLQPGDLLYLPRGTIHQGEAVEGHPSHHLTISTYQRHSWADFLEKALPEALARASQQPGDSLFREGLPLRCWSYLGEQHQGNSPARDAFQAQLRARLLALAEHLAPAADAAGDVLAAQLVARRLPPPAPRSAAAAALDEAAEAEDPAVRWADPLAVRVVVEKGPTGEEIQIYHSRENGAAGHMQADVEPEPACIVLEGLEFLPALQALNNACGKWILASSVDPDLVEGLMEHGLLELGDSRLCDLAPSGRPPRRRPRRRGATGRSAGGGVAGKAAAPSAGSKT